MHLDQFIKLDMLIVLKIEFWSLTSDILNIRF